MGGRVKVLGGTGSTKTDELNNPLDRTAFADILMITLIIIAFSLVLLIGIGLFMHK